MAHPLLCWDIVQEGFERRKQFSNDLIKLKSISEQNKWHKLYRMPDCALVWENKVIVITDSLLKIVHVTENMYDMNGYLPKEVIGKSPKMFQGDKTTLEERKAIKIAVADRTNFDTIITNYKKDGSIYKCHIEGYPIFNTKGRIVNFIAFENAA